MDLKLFLSVFTMVFVAELGDKTQLATFLFSADKTASKLTVFLGAGAALLLATVIAVLAGTFLSGYINEKYLHYAAGGGFIIIGLWTLYTA